MSLVGHFFGGHGVVLETSDHKRSVNVTGQSYQYLPNLRIRKICRNYIRRHMRRWSYFIKCKQITYISPFKFVISVFALSFTTFRTRHGGAIYCPRDKVAYVWSTVWNSLYKISIPSLLAYTFRRVFSGEKQELWLSMLTRRATYQATNVCTQAVRILHQLLREYVEYTGNTGVCQCTWNRC